MGIEVMTAAVEVVLSTFSTAIVPWEAMGTYALLPMIAVEPEPPMFELTTETPKRLEIGESGSGFVTLTATLEFACEVVAVPEAVNWVDETKVVVELRAVPPKLTTAPGTNFDPFSVSVNGPSPITLGETEDNTGIGLSRLTVVDPVAIALPIVAETETVTAFEEGRGMGAV